jgi:hypothetical protein
VVPTQQANVHFSMENGIIPAVKRIEFVRDMILCIILRGCLCDTVMNVHAQRKDETESMKDSFYERLECVFNKLTN